MAFFGDIKLRPTRDRDGGSGLGSGLRPAGQAGFSTPLPATTQPAKAKLEKVYIRKKGNSRSSSRSGSRPDDGGNLRKRYTASVTESFVSEGHAMDDNQSKISSWGLGPSEEMRERSHYSTKQKRRHKHYN